MANDVATSYNRPLAVFVGLRFANPYQSQPHWHVDNLMKYLCLFLGPILFSPSGARGDEAEDTAAAIQAVLPKAEALIVEGRLMNRRTLS